jgi:hypothetical protein
VPQELKVLLDETDALKAQISPLFARQLRAHVLHILDGTPFLLVNEL